MTRGRSASAEQLDRWLRKCNGRDGREIKLLRHSQSKQVVGMVSPRVTLKPTGAESTGLLMAHK